MKKTKDRNVLVPSHRHIQESVELLEDGDIQEIQSEVNEEITYHIKEVQIKATKIVGLNSNGDEVTRALLCYLPNEDHPTPSAYIEDVSVREDYQRQGLSKEMHDMMFELMKHNNVYKAVATSRFEKDHVHRFYEDKYDFTKHGFTFRKDFKKK